MAAIPFPAALSPRSVAGAARLAAETLERAEQLCNQAEAVYTEASEQARGLLDEAEAHRREIIEAGRAEAARLLTSAISAIDESVAQSDAARADAEHDRVAAARLRAAAERELEAARRLRTEASSVVDLRQPDAVPC